MALKGATTTKEPPDIGIGKLLRRAHSAFSREFRARLAVHDVTFSEFIHLERLWDEEGINQREISKRVGITSASSTQVIETLERRGFIVRKRNPADRRNINIFLTPLGRRVKPQLLECAKATNRVARAGLSASDTVTLFRLVETIISNLDSRADGAHGRTQGNGLSRKERRAGRFQ